MTLYPEQAGATRSKVYLHIHAGQGSLSTAVAIDFYTVEGGLPNGFNPRKGCPAGPQLSLGNSWGSGVSML